jgi:dTDP-4-amino-4,6-dideoxygalactose transaminase
MPSLEDGTLPPVHPEREAVESNSYPSVRSLRGAVSEQIVSLPVYPNMSEADVRDVVETARSIVRRYRR